MPRLRIALARLRAAALADITSALPIVNELAPATPEIAALWRDVEAHPDDDASLAVLADALQLAGDPRGELIALQLIARDHEAATIERRKALIASFGAACLGRLTQITSAASFERGVMRRLQLADTYLASDPRWNALRTDPALATITDLLPGDAGPGVYARFMTSPAMCSLARIEISDHAALAAFADTAPSIMHIACDLAMTGEMLETFALCAGLQSIALEISSLAQLASAPWFSRLTAVTLGVRGGGLRDGLARWAELPRSMTLTLVPSCRLPPCTTGFPWDFGITLARDGGATIARISGDWLLHSVELLTALPSDVARVEVDHPNDAMVDRIASALRRPAVEVVHRPERRVAAVFVPTPHDRIASAGSLDAIPIGSRAGG